MVNRPRTLGTIAESAVVEYLATHGWPYAERRSLKGALDRGDITGCPGLCFEVKYAHSQVRIGAWLAETAVERLNAKADFGVLVVKPLGLGIKSVGSWFAVLSQHDLDGLRLLTGVQTLDQWNADPEVVVVDGKPETYSAKTLRWTLTGAVRRAAPREVVALTLRPPGTKEQPDRWYRVMTFEHAVRLLLAAGFGEKYAVGGREVEASEPAP
jgi:hypothetical protein